MLVVNVPLFREWLRQQTLLVVDTETNIVENDHERFLVGVSFYSGECDPWYLPVGHVPTLVPVENVKLWDFSQDLRPDVTLIFHNMSFDLKVLRRHGIDLMGFDTADTMLWHHLLDQYRPHRLEDLEVSILKRNQKQNILKNLKGLGKDIGYEGVPPVAMAKYAENDVVATYGLYANFRPKLESIKTESGHSLVDLWEQVDQPFRKLLTRIEESGLKLDLPLAQQLAAESKDRMCQIQQRLPFEPSKNLEVCARFYGEPPFGLGLLPSKISPKTGKPSVDESVLAGINHPEAGLLLEYRGLAKAVSTWFEGFQGKVDERGYLHPTFNQHGTITHRLSSQNPNAQQIPREGRVKSLFLPEINCDLVEFDYSAIEFRLACFYGQIEELMDAFKNGVDVHQLVANRFGIHRQTAKNTNFCVVYGGGAGRIAETAGIPLRDAKELYQDYKARYRGIFDMSERCARLAQERKWIKQWDGRRCIFKFHEYKDAFNRVVQGGAFQIIKRSMLMLDVELGVDMRNQVHDAIWVNIPKGDSYDPIIKTMVDWTVEKFGFPFTVEAKVLHE